MKKLVTVTCDRDLNQLILQSHSIDLFVKEKIQHFIFVENTTKSIEDWYKILKPFYSKHDLQLFLQNVNADMHGWYNQQIIKLNAVNYINDDYIVLDSKNFFIKPTNLNYTIPEGSYLLLDSTGWTDKFSKYLKNVYNLSVPTYFYTQQTPFFMRKSVVERILTSIDINKLFVDCAKEQIYPSEFLLYGIFSDIKPNKKEWNKNYESHTIYFTWWWNYQIEESEFENIYNSTVDILGIHKNVWFHKNNKIKILCNWLVSKGLNLRYVAPATINMDWGDTYLQDESPTL